MSKATVSTTVPTPKGYHQGSRSGRKSARSSEPSGGVASRMAGTITTIEDPKWKGIPYYVGKGIRRKQ